MKKSLRILQVADLYPPLIGGTERHVAILAREFASRGHHSAVATMRLGGISDRTVGAFGEVVYRIGEGWSTRLPGVQEEGRPHHPSFPDPGVSRALRTIVERERPDILYGHNWMIFSYLASRRAGDPPASLILHDYGLTCPARSHNRASGVPCSHGSSREMLGCGSEHYGQAKGTAVAAGLLASRRALVSRLQGIAAVSESIAAPTRSLLGCREIRVLPTFVDRDLLNIGMACPRPSFLPEKDFILFVGAMTQMKGISTLLAAYERLPRDGRPALVLLGTRRSDTPKVWPEGVYAFENVLHADVLASWRECLFGVVPSVWPEPFGQVAVEAMTFGKAVVASNIGGLAETLEDRRSGLLVNPGDVSALSEALFLLIENESFRDRLGRSAELRAEKFTIDSVVEQVEDFLFEGYVGK